MSPELLFRPRGQESGPIDKVFAALDHNFAEITDNAATDLQVTMDYVTRPGELSEYELKRLENHRRRLMETALEVSDILALRSVEWDYDLAGEYQDLLRGCGVLMPEGNEQAGQQG